MRLLMLGIAMLISLICAIVLLVWLALRRPRIDGGRLFVISDARARNRPVSR